jgi:hypothetical protein
VTWLPWRKRLEQADEAVRAAEVLRAEAEEQQRQAERIAPRVAAVSSSLQKLRTDNHFGPLIDSILRGSE